MSQYLTNVWNSMTNNDIWQEWPYGSGNHFSKYDIRAFRNYIFHLMNAVLNPIKGFDRLVSIGTTTMYYKYKTIELDRIPYANRRESVAQVVAASAAYPIYLPPLEFENAFLMDGSIKKFVDIDTAIERCLEKVGDESDIVLDVILTAAQGREVIEPNNSSWLSSEWKEVASSMAKHKSV